MAPPRARALLGAKRALVVLSPFALNVRGVRCTYSARSP